MLVSYSVICILYTDPSQALNLPHSDLGRLVLVLAILFRVIHELTITPF